ncbi:FAD-dependent oxidoreductase [Undibacterium pigrum]|uniref:Flavin-dependent monooxygenase n=1 Tax=Undibacterium pigrum TaxID=401470 RepID=A0A318JF85_9BURK|nr:NAD(P)/FAD-dependent oxidoreductase [Undibacterium pigrum]PXX46515.1 2-polyprenyl-6-methoxyphenol hydroxylase-like FAD-dependent oxidoreductase [Undibacterium pigrum]
MRQIHKQSPIQDKQIAIIGAGPGGLTLARLLQMHGAKVKVFERDINQFARVQGATLNLNEGSGLSALRAAGLMEAFELAYRPGAEKMLFVDAQAAVIIDELDSESNDRPEIDRGPLRNLLLASLMDDTVVWDARFSSLQRTEESVEIAFENGNKFTADLLIAADGANSKIRPYITPLAPEYSGVTVLEGSVADVANTIPELYELLDGGKVCVLDDEKTLFIVLKGDGSVAFYTGHKADQDWCRQCGIDFSDREQVLAWFRQEFKGWSDIWAELFRHATLPFMPRPQFCAPVDQHWQSLSNLTMLGDAAHVMPPYAGEGVNMAMQDALVLASQLLNPDMPDMRAAIAAYETEMRERNAQTAAETLKFTRVFHSYEAVPFFREFFSGNQDVLLQNDGFRVAA